MNSTSDGVSSDEKRFSDPDDLLAEVEADNNVVDDFTSDATVVSTERGTFKKEEQKRLFAEVKIDSEPLSPDKYHRATTNHVPFSQKFSEEPEQYTEKKVKFIEYGVTPKACPDCDGSGDQICIECQGEGETPCTECNTTGNTDCTTCSGKGEIKCSTCNRSGFYQCEHCEGSGQFECPKCEGTRKDECSCIDQPGQVGQVPAYREQERKSAVGSRSQSEKIRTVETFVRCQYCDGNGKRSCDMCDGSGILDCERCDGSKKEVCPDCRDGWKFCPDCRGNSNRECSNCRGKGTEICDECSGQGKLACENCDHTGELYYAQHGSIKYTPERNIEWEQNEDQMKNVVGSTEIKSIKKADGNVVEQERTYSEKVPPIGERSKIRQDLIISTVPAQSLTYEYDNNREGTIAEIEANLDSKGTITEIDSDIDYDIATTAFTKTRE